MAGKHITRNPAGLVKGKPIALRLMPEELAEAERLATKYGLSRSALARQAFLVGLPILDRKAS